MYIKLNYEWDKTKFILALSLLGKKKEKPARDDIGLDGNILGLPPLIFFYYYLSIYCQSLFTYFDLIVKS